MNRLPLPSLLLASFLLIGCQKEVHEVRRTHAPIDGSTASGYSADPGGYGVNSGSRYSVNTGPRYNVGGITPGSPSAPRLEPNALGTPRRKAARD